MSGTSSQRLQALKGQLDHLFANAHPADRPDLIQELRGYLSGLSSALRSAVYDPKHSNAATMPGTGR